MHFYQNIILFKHVFFQRDFVGEFRKSDILKIGCYVGRGKTQEIKMENGGFATHCQSLSRLLSPSPNGSLTREFAVHICPLARRGVPLYHLCRLVMNTSEVVGLSGGSCNCSLENMTKCQADYSIISPVGARIFILAGNQISDILERCIMKNGYFFFFSFDDFFSCWQ